MPTDNVAIASKGTVRKVDSSFPPGGSAVTTTGGFFIERSFDSTSSQYRIRLFVAKFIPPSHPGATGFTFNFSVTVAAEHHDDSSYLVVQSYGDWLGSISASDYNEGELDIDFPSDMAAIVLLSSLGAGTHAVTLSGPVPPSPFHCFRFGVTVGSIPLGLNDLSISVISYDVSYELSATPGMLALNGNTANGVEVGENDDQIFTWATGQASTAFDFYNAAASSGYGSPVHVDTPAQTHTIAGGTHAPGPRKWKVVSYDSEGNPSAESEQKAYKVVGSLDEPTVSPSGTVTASLLTLSATGAETHVKEQWQIKQSGAVIYNTGKLAQSSNSHAMSAQYFTNGKTRLDNNTDYEIHYYYFNADGDVGHGTSDISVELEPLETPVFYVTPGQSSLDFTIDNQADENVIANDIEATESYDPDAPEDAVWTKINATDIDPDGAFSWFEAKHNQVYYFRVVARSADSEERSAVQNATLLRSVWIEIFDPLDAADSIARFEGWITLGGNESGYSQSFAPSAVAVQYVGRETPVINRQVSADGNLMGVRTWSVTVMTITDANFDGKQLKARAEALLTRPTNLCICNNEEPVGRVIKGGVMSLSGPAPLDSRMKRYVFSFTFIESR